MHLITCRGTFRASIRRKDKKSPTTESKTTTPSGLTHVAVSKQDRKTSLDQSVQPVNGSSIPAVRYSVEINTGSI